MATKNEITQIFARVAVLETRSEDTARAARAIGEKLDKIRDEKLVELKVEDGKLSDKIEDRCSALKDHFSQEIEKIHEIISDSRVENGKSVVMLKVLWGAAGVLGGALVGFFISKL